MLSFKKLIFMFSQYLLLLLVDARPSIKITSGRIKGTVMKSFNGRPIYAFMSIPYAKQPLGQLRFKELEEVEPWSGVLDAGRPPEACIQARTTLYGVEDCLFINVYTPRSPSEIAKNRNGTLLPVVVYIHGGAYYFLSSSLYGPRYLLDSDVLLVTFNFRMGPLGFLSSEDEVMPGNLGMKDQVVVLKWVQRNIHYFGGNASSVTLMGMSAGATCVHLHYMSPLSKNLFRNGIMIGGTAFNVWAMQSNPRQKLRRVADLVGCYEEISEELVECLRNVPADRLIKTTKSLQSKILDVPIAPLAPVIEKPSKNAFLIENPFQSLLSGKMFDGPTLFSTTDNEGMYPIGGLIRSPSLLDEVNRHWISFCITLLDFVDNFSELQDACHKIRNFYCGKRPLTTDSFNCLIRMVTDRFRADMSRALSLTSLVVSRVNFYVFSYKGRYSSSITLSGIMKNDQGTNHVDDVVYYLNTTNSIDLLESSTEDIKMMKVISPMAAKFALTGKAEWPGYKWEPVDRVKLSDIFRGKLNYLRIFSPDNATMVRSSNFGNSKFWNSLPICQPWSGRFPASSSPPTLVNTNCLGLLHRYNYKQRFTK